MLLSQATNTSSGWQDSTNGLRKSPNFSCVRPKLGSSLSTHRIMQEVGYSKKKLLRDNGGEFDKGDTRKVLNSKEITQRLTAPYTPDQNGGTDRKLRTVGEMKPKRFEDHIAAKSYLDDNDNPEIYEEAVNSKDSTNWNKAMKVK
ncbi:hypothetical protein NPIL_284161 [Nephila pilipes]|uniref:Integrase catalytic domain-containing protein n=1 Tax=Nephila pilipes TaxID=299642 RepID=A0A8X6TF82_NEPPI|nr:hypothetical protein NPIL_284161 [Nephila pilipes]